MNYEEQFKAWLKDDNNHEYSEKTIAGYISALRTANELFNVQVNPPLMEIDNIQILKAQLRVIEASDVFEEVNERGHRRFSSAASAYQKFLSSLCDFTWIPFYIELADKLLEYKNNRNALIKKLIAIFGNIGIKFPKMEIDTFPVDIDPFTVFGMFNKGITETNRCAIIKGFAEEFGIKAEQPKSFPGIPVLNNLKATFFYMLSDRGEKDIDNLWTVFSNAIILAEEDNQQNREAFVAAFDRVLSQQGIRWNITMGLFWIRPYYFINLDSRNRRFLTNAKNTTEEYAAALPKFDKVPAGVEYLKICDASKNLVKLEQLPFSTLPELSAYAWSVSKEVDTHDEEEPQGGSGNDTLADGDVKKIRYWIYSPGEQAYKWEQFYQEGIMAIGWSAIGDLSQYASKEDMKVAMKQQINPSYSYKNSALATWQFANEMGIGDVVFVKKGGKTIVGRGVVTSDYRFDGTVTDDYKNLRSVHWTHCGEWKRQDSAAQKTLTDITQFTDDLEKLNALFAEEMGSPEEEPEVTYPVYTEEDFLHDVYMSADDYHTLVSVLMKKKNIILQGAPGVGKTYAAKRLAYSIIGKKDQNRVMMIQFHQSYSYEDFIEGYRPAAEGFSIKKGAFYKFCKKAQEDDENEYFFIIDEINRGNLSKIFGELFMLIETDKRGVELQLLYSDEKFSVPKNVHIIGMMNKADRSLAMLDYALRRRFSFVDMKPGFDTDGFVQYRDSLANEKFNALVRCVQQLNGQIKDDAALGEGFCIGHSYFCALSPDTVSDKELSSIVEFELIPLLREYWFDEADKVADWSARLRGAVK